MSKSQSPLDTIFNAAKALPPQDQQVYLDAACRGRPELRNDVERMLAAAKVADDFFAAPVPGLTELSHTVAGEVISEGPGTVIGRYKLIQQIGEGGMGVVYMAEQTQPVVRKVALKIIKLGMDTKSVIARFEAERQALALMDHPNIAKVLDAGSTETGRPYFVMELVRGVPITQYCDHQHLSARQRLELFLPVCQAIQHAHQKGIIHRDIKPSNVLVTLLDGDPLPMVIDFGIAKATNQRLTEKTLYTDFAQMIGTPAYMSPEQAEMSKLDVDTRTDIYALGVLLYELLTGTTPFSGQELLEAGYQKMQRMIAEQDPPRPSTRLSTMQQDQRTTVARNRRMESSALTRLFQGDLDWIVMKCLEKDRTRRYEAANALATDLQRHLGNEPVLARPPTAAYRFQKAIRRHRTAFVAGAAVVLALVVGLATASWQAVRATKAEKDQSRLREEAVVAAAKEGMARKKAEEAQAKEQLERQRAESSEQKAQRLLYGANLNLIQQAWEANNIGHVRQLLDETAAYPNKGFEWYYWQRQVPRPAMTLPMEGADSVAYSADGKRILAGGKEGVVKVWESATGKSLLRFIADSNAVSKAVFSPDGQRILTACWDEQTAKLWDASTGRKLLTLQEHGARVGDAAFFPDGKRVVTAAYTDDPNAPSPVSIWDAINGDLLLSFNGHAGGVGVAVSPDGSRVLTFGYSAGAKVYDAANGKTLLTLTDESTSSASFSPDGRQIVAEINWKDAIIWDATTGTQLMRLQGRHTSMRQPRFSADGTRIAAITGPGPTVTIWNVVTGEEVLSLERLSDTIGGMAISPDGLRLAVAGSVGSAPGLDCSGLRLWDLTKREGATQIGDGDTVCSPSFVAVSADRIAATYSKDCQIVLWEALKGTKLSTLQFEKGTRLAGFKCEDLISTPTFSQDGSLFSVIAVTNVNSGMSSVEISMAGKYAVAKVWESSTGRELAMLPGYRVAFSPDGKHIVTCQEDCARVWETTTGKQVLTIAGHTFAGYSPDGKRILTCGDKETARLWSADSGKEMVTFRGHMGMLYSARFSPDGQRIVTASMDRTARVWDAASGELLTTFTGHHGDVLYAQFFPGGDRILSISVSPRAGHTGKVWDTTTGREMLTLDIEHSPTRDDVGISADGRRIVGFAFDPKAESNWRPYAKEEYGPLTMKTWEAATPEQVAQWQREERGTGEGTGASVEGSRVTSETGVSARR